MVDLSIVNVECAIEHSGEFLVIQRPKGKHAEGLLSFPGGKFEQGDGNGGEDVLHQAVKREILEEVGLVLQDPIRYVTSSYFLDEKSQKPIVDVIFHCKISNRPEQLKVSHEEVPWYAWLSFEEIVQSENCPEWLQKYLKWIVS